MNFEPTTVKGFQDYMPKEALLRKKIVETAEKYFKLYGFLPIETPIIEYDELMKSDNLPSEEEDEAISDRFRLKDKGARNLGLRYEFTFQLARIFKENPNIKLPFRRYQIGPIFRDEPLRLGRTRQFIQCDIDIVGDNSINAEAECLSLVSDILKSLGIKEFEMKINNRKLLNAIIESVEISNTKQVMKEIDKIEKIGEDQVKINLKKYTSSNQIITLFKLMEKNISFFKDNAFEGANELLELIEKCDFYGIKTKFSPSMVRGFGYYTGNVFEFALPKKSSIAGGGRYDKVIGKYSGREITSVGISFSLESITSLCEEELSKINIEHYPKVLIISFNQDEKAIDLLKKLRNKNVSCEMSAGKPGKQLEYANAKNIPFVIFIGEEEINQKKLKIKDMSSGKEEIMGERNLIKMLSE